jgi:uncharacterized protein
MTPDAVPGASRGVKESRYNIWVERGEAAYVFNGLSGALLRLPADQHGAVRRFLDGDEGGSPSPKVLEQLALGRMLVPGAADEREVLRARYDTSRHDASHFALTIVTSLGCNFDCPYCFEAKHPSILDGEVRDLLLQVVDDQLARIRSMRVSWFGGEPLVGRKPLFELSDAFIARCDRAGVEYGADIVTNGYLLDETMCAALRDRRVTSAQVGLDGPPDVHDRMRPLVGGRPSFWGIVRNLHHAVEYLDVVVRVNLDKENAGRAEELFRILADQGLSGKLSVYPGQLVGVTDDPRAPSSSYHPRCLGIRDFARTERDFLKLAAAYGFSRPSLPRPTGAPCTAVRANELVVGSRGELYKCWDNVGNPKEVIGHLREYGNPNGRLQKWLKYDPFTNDECLGCIALPVCMGGCAHHAMDALQYENRCGTFRYTYHEQVEAFVAVAERDGIEGLVASQQLARRMETK